MENRNSFNGATDASRGRPHLAVVGIDSTAFSYDVPFGGRPANLNQAVTQALGAGFGLALREAEASLHVCRLFTEERANEQAAGDAIAKVRKALDEMQAALPQAASDA